MICYHAYVLGDMKACVCDDDYLITFSLSSQDALEEELRIALTTGVIPDDEKAPCTVDPFPHALVHSNDHRANLRRLMLAM